MSIYLILVRKNKLKMEEDRLEQYDLPDLLINIWCYSDPEHHELHQECCTCNMNCELCVGAAKRKWSSFYKDFNYVIYNLKTNKKLYNFGKISRADKSIIYGIIRKSLFKFVFFSINIF